MTARKSLGSRAVASTGSKRYSTRRSGKQESLKTTIRSFLPAESRDESLRHWAQESLSGREVLIFDRDLQICLRLSPTTALRLATEIDNAVGKILGVR